MPLHYLIYSDEMEDIEDILNKLSKLRIEGESSRDYIVRQDIAYYIAKITDLWKERQRVQVRIDELTQQLNDLFPEEEQLQQIREEVEEEISRDILSRLPPQALRQYNRLLRLRRYELQPEEHEKFEQLKEEYLATINYSDTEGQEEELRYYELPNGIQIYFDLNETLRNGRRGESGDIFVHIGDKTYRLPMRDEFIEDLQELSRDIEEEDSITRQQERIRQSMAMLEDRLAWINQELYNCIQQSKRQFGL